MRDARTVMADIAASGLSADQLALVMELSAALAVEARPTEDKAATKRRKRDREYQAQRRQNRTISADSADSAPYEDTSTPPSETKVSSGVVKPPARKNGIRVPEGWQPQKPYPPDVAAMLARWPPGRLERELIGFVDYWLARNRDYARTDWDRTWWNRIRDIHDRVMKAKNGQELGDNLRGDRPNPALDMWLAANAELEAEDAERRDEETGVRNWPALPAGQSH